jgi:hypothetical protein
MNVRILAVLSAAAALSATIAFAQEAPAPVQNQNNFSLGFGINSIAIDGQNWTRVNLMPVIPVGQFKFAFDLDVFLDNTGKLSSKSWEFTSPDESVDSILRKIYYISFGDKASVLESRSNILYARFGALDNVTLGEGIIMNSYRNDLNYPIQKNLGLEFTIGNLSDFRFGLEGMINNFEDFAYGGGVVGGRLFASPLAPTKIPFLENLQFGVTYVADLNQYAGLPIKTITNNVPLTASQLQTISNAYLSAGVSNFDAGSLPPNEQTAYIGNDRNIFSELGADFILPILPGFLELYGQFAMNIDPDGNSSGTNADGWGFTVPGIRIGPKDFLEARLDYRMQSGAFEMSYFDSEYDNFRAVLVPNSTNVTLKEDLLSADTNFLAGIFGSVKVNLFIFWGYLSAEQLWDIRQSSAPVNPMTVEGRLFLNTNFVAQVPILKDYLKDLSAYYIQNNITNYSELFQPETEVQIGFNAALKIGGTTSIVYSFQRTYTRNSIGVIVPDDIMTIGSQSSF